MGDTWNEYQRYVRYCEREADIKGEAVEVKDYDEWCEGYLTALGY